MLYFSLIVRRNATTYAAPTIEMQTLIALLSSGRPTEPKINHFHRTHRSFALAISVISLCCQD